jgi:hypothetical protein
MMVSECGCRLAEKLAHVKLLTNNNNCIKQCRVVACLPLRQIRMILPGQRSPNVWGTYGPARAPFPTDHYSAGIVDPIFSPSAQISGCKTLEWF